MPILKNQTTIVASILRAMPETFATLINVKGQDIWQIYKKISFENRTLHLQVLPENKHFEMNIYDERLRKELTKASFYLKKLFDTHGLFVGYHHLSLQWHGAVLDSFELQDNGNFLLDFLIFDGAPIKHAYSEKKDYFMHENLCVVVSNLFERYNYYLENRHEGKCDE